MRNRKSLITLVATAALIFSQHLPAVATDTPACTVTVSASNTVYNGTNSSDVICITGDNDTVNALGGDDTIVDSGDNNTINLGDGNDYYLGLTGDSATVDGGAGNDDLEGTPGNDTLDGGDGNDTIVGGSGDDFLDGGNGADSIEGDAGADKIYGDAGTDVLAGGADNDLVAGGDGIDVLDGGTGLNNCDYTTGEAVTQTCVYDDQAPTATVTVTNVDLTVDHPTMTFHIVASDLTGINYVSLYCQSVWVALQWKEHWFGLGSAPDQPEHVSEDWGNSTSTNIDYTGTISLSKNEWPSGTKVCQMTTVDVLGNTKTLQNQASFNVVSLWDQTFGADKTAPTVTMSLDSSTVDVTNADALVGFDYTAHDDYGLKQDEADCASRDATGGGGDRFAIGGTGFLWGSGRGHISVINRVGTGDTHDVHVTGSFKIPKDTIPGVYHCSSFALDQAGNMATVDLGISLTVTDSTDQASLTPVINSATISTSQVDTGSAGADVRVAFSTSTITKLDQSNFQCTKYVGDQVDNSDFTYFYADVTSTLYGGTNFQLQSNNPSVTFTTNSSAFTDHSAALDVTFHLPFGMRPGDFRCTLGVGDLNGRVRQQTVGNLKILRTPAGQPSQPKDLSFTPSNWLKTSGTLTWNAPDNVGSPSLNGYLVQYSTDGGVTWLDLPHGATTNTSLNVSGLTGGTNYKFRVRGDNGGTANQDVNFMTLSYGTIGLQTLTPVQPSVPQNLNMTGVTASGANIAWQAPADNGGSPITELRLEVSRDGQTWTQVNPNGGLALSYGVNGLAPGTSYQVRVSAINVAGQSDYLTGSFTTAAMSASKPVSLAVSNLSYKTLSLAWGSSATNGGAAITDYDVQFSTNGQTWTSIPHSALTSRGFNVTGLALATTYYFRVAPVTSVGTGAYSDVVTATTKADAPTAPTSLSVSAKTTSVVLGWKASNGGNATAISNFIVEYSKDGKMWTTVKKSVSTSTSLNVTGLKSKTKYQFRVTAVNSVGKSAVSKVLTVTTK